jgi:group I intron endonuclease
MYVYQIINSLNNKSYIGITNNIKTRFEYHRTRYNKTNKGEFIEKPLYKAFRKYGIENFKFVVLFENLSVEEAKSKEIELISELKTLTHENGYNVTKGGDWRNNCGENNNTTILKEQDVIDIRRRIADGENIKTVYESYSNRITFSGFQGTYLGRNWKHLGGVIKNILPNGASISKDTVLKIRKMYEKDKKNPHQIAKELGLEYKKCLRICKRETYKNI